MIQIKVSEFIRGSQGFTLDLCETEEQFRLLTLRDLKQKISPKTGIDQDRLWLCMNATLRDDNCFLSEYGITHQTEIYYLCCSKPEKIQLNFNNYSGHNFCIWLDDLDQTVSDLKNCIEDSEGIPSGELRIIYGGKQLEDGRLLSEYELQHMAVLHCVLRLRGGGTPDESSGSMGDRDGKNASMDFLADFVKPNRCIIN